MLEVWIVVTEQECISHLGSHSLTAVAQAVWSVAASEDLAIVVAGVHTDVMVWLNSGHTEGPVLVSGSKVTLDLFCSFLV